MKPLIKMFPLATTTLKLSIRAFDEALQSSLCGSSYAIGAGFDMRSHEGLAARELIEDKNNELIFSTALLPAESLRGQITSGIYCSLPGSQFVIVDAR
jgi:hypothetical protein